MGQLKSTLGQKCKARVNSIQGLNNKFNSIQLGFWEELKTAGQLKSTFFNFIPHTTYNLFVSYLKLTLTKI